jgi:hypothetical protein
LAGKGQEQAKKDPNRPGNGCKHCDVRGLKNIEYYIKGPANMGFILPHCTGPFQKLLTGGINI